MEVGKMGVGDGSKLRRNGAAWSSAEHSYARSGPSKPGDQPPTRMVE